MVGKIDIGALHAARDGASGDLVAVPAHRGLTADDHVALAPDLTLGDQHPPGLDDDLVRRSGDLLELALRARPGQNGQ